MGVHILGTSTISESSGGGGPIMYAAEAAKASDSAPPVQVGPVTVSAQVTVTFVYAL